ncbi:MAG: NADPH-dependent oxidoreductase, partial [Rhizobiaceae bacterium]
MYMADKLKILVILGSVREGRMAEPVGRWVMAQAEGRDALDCELIDLKEWDFPFYAFPDAPAKGNYQDPLQRRWAEKVGSADGYILICPEYNHGPPAVLKNALDFVYAEWNRKPVAFVGYGGTWLSPSVSAALLDAEDIREEGEPPQAMKDWDASAKKAGDEPDPLKNITFDTFDPDLKSADGPPQAGDDAPARIFMRGIGQALWYNWDWAAAGNPKA